MKKYCFVYELSEFNLNGPFHIINAYTYVATYPHLNFAFQVSDVIAQRIANTNHATPDIAICKHHAT